MVVDRKGTGSGVLFIQSNEEPPAEYEIRIEYSFEPGGVPQLTGYGVRRTDGQPLPDAARRWIEAHVATDLVDKAYAKAIAEEELVVDLGAGTLTLGGEATFKVASGRVIRRRHADPGVVERDVVDSLGRQRRQRMTPEFLAEVAEVYLAHPDAPTKAVRAWRIRTRGTCSSAQASRYVRAARDAGLLPEREA